MAGPTFVGDPFSGEGQLVYENGQAIEGNVSDFFGGRFRASNGFMVTYAPDEAGNMTFQTSSPIGRSGPFTIAELANDRYSLITTTQTGRANIQMGNDQLRMVAGPIGVLDATGNMVQFSVGPIPINNLDHTWVAYLRDDGTYGFANIKGTYSSTAAVQADLGAGYRLATPYEAASQAISKSLYMLNRDTIANYATDMDLMKDDGTPDISGAIRQMMQVGDMSQLTFTARTVYEF